MTEVILLFTASAIGGFVAWRLGYEAGVLSGKQYREVTTRVVAKHLRAACERHRSSDQVAVSLKRQVLELTALLGIDSTGDVDQLTRARQEDSVEKESDDGDEDL